MRAVVSRIRADGQTKSPDQYARAVSERSGSIRRGFQPAGYPFVLPLLRDDFELSFDEAITITRREWHRQVDLAGRIAVMAGYDDAGGGRATAPSTTAVRWKNGRLARGGARASWLPKITNGWFFGRASSRWRAISMKQQWTSATAARLPVPHEGFLRFFEERCRRQGIFIFDEPESALSPSRQTEFLKLLHRMHGTGHCQVIMATHSPILMAYPNATLLRLTRYGLEPVNLRDTDHYRLMREFCDDPNGFVEAVITE